MRAVVGFLVAAAVGVHCSAPAEIPGTSAPELSGSQAPSAPPARAGDQPTVAPVPGDPKPPGPVEQTTPDLSAFIRDASTTHVTSTIVDPTSGATYATGTFENDVVIGKTLLESRGDKDVFLLKVGTGGTFEWVRGIGSAFAENDPHVTLDGTEVNVIGMTLGAMDCGAGPLPTWSSDTFFFCIFGAMDGASLSGGVFPTGTP